MSIRSFRLSDDHEVLVDNSGIFAVRQSGHVEVWDTTQSVLYGYLPYESQPGHIRAAMEFYRYGVSIGINSGITDLKRQFKKLFLD